MSVSEEKLAGVDQALAELGKSDEEISEVRGLFANTEPVDLQAADGELSELTDGLTIKPASAGAPAAEARAPEPADESWDDEHTEVEIIDESDFVLLVDEDELEELEKVGEDDAMRTSPPAIPQEGQEGDSFFKKLFSGRRSSNRPQ